jgi:hypothetical protein
LLLNGLETQFSALANVLAFKWLEKTLTAAPGRLSRWGTAETAALRSHACLAVLMARNGLKKTFNAPLVLISIWIRHHSRADSPLCVETRELALASQNGVSAGPQCGLSLGHAGEHTELLLLALHLFGVVVLL